MTQPHIVYVAHNGFQDQRYDLEDFASAIATCERIVDEFLVPAATGISTPELMECFVTRGPKPWIDGADPEHGFSVWKYAEVRCRELAGDLWNPKDGTCDHADSREFDTGLSSAEIGNRVTGLHEPFTFGGTDESGSLSFIVRMRDGSSLRLFRESDRTPVSGTVILPRERERNPYLYHQRRRKFNPEDAPSCLNSIAGLLKHPGSPRARALERIQEAIRESPMELFLDECGLTELPEEIWQMVNLECLNLSGNWLTRIPPEIARLTKLQVLSVEGNRLANLPREIGRLHNLTEIHADRNLLDTLPSEIGQLTALKSLQLTGNLLTELPPEIGRLANLEWLRVSENRIERLPEEMEALSSLQCLDVDRNRLTQLPHGICKLANLQTLWVHYNRLTALPLDLKLWKPRAPERKTTPLHEREEQRAKRISPGPPPALMVHGNPLTDYPREVKSAENA